jgi:hypothetical protein
VPIAVPTLLRKPFVKPKHIINTTHTKFINQRKAKMTEKMDKHHIRELKEMIHEKEPEEPVEEVLVKFCERHAVSLDACRKHYEKLVEKGEIKEK